MERFRFGEQEGFNGKKTTVNGFLSIFGEDRCHLEIAGPKGGERAMLIFDKATARKVGTALLKWAGVRTGNMILVAALEEIANLPYSCNYRERGQIARIAREAIAKAKGL